MTDPIRSAGAGYEKWFSTAAREQPGFPAESLAARREQMLGELRLAVIARRKRRTATRWMLSVAAAILLVTLAFAWARTNSNPLERTPVAERGMQAGAEPHDRLEALPLRHVDFAVIKTPAGILARFTAPSRQLAADVFLDDDALIEELEGRNHPATLIRVDGRSRVYPDVAEHFSE